MMPAIPNPTILILHRPYLKASTILGSRGVASLPSSFHSSQCVHAFWYSRRAGIYCSTLFVSTASSQSQADNDGRGRPGALTPQLVTLQEIDVNTPKGTGDFPPRKCGCAISCLVISERFQGFSGSEEVDFPVLESEALFIRKAGEEIREQLYCFEDRGNRRFALRPELTPSLARLVIQKGKSASLPLKWFAVGQCWRYERMTRGRRREHYQWNMDIIGVPEVTVPEILKAMSSYMVVLEYPMTTIDRNAFKAPEILIS